MNIILKVIAIGFVAAFLNQLLKKTNPEYALGITVSVSVIIFTVIKDFFISVWDKLKELSRISQLDNSYISVILKIIIIAYICEYCSAMIEDSGEKAIAKKIELSGKLIIFIMAFPVLNELFKTVISII